MKLGRSPCKRPLIVDGKGKFARNFEGLTIKFIQKSKQQYNIQQIFYLPTQNELHFNDFKAFKFRVQPSLESSKFWQIV